MASTVNTAFEEFLKDTVRLDSEQITSARKSRDIVDRMVWRKD